MVSLKRLADGLAAWWRRTAWPEPARKSPPLVAAGRALLRAWGEALRSFGADQLGMQANALTFLTLLSLVPLLAVSFSLFAAFGGLQASEKTLHRLIAQNLAPGPAEAAMEHLRQFAARTSAGAVGGVGVVLLFLTVVALLSSIEQAMNSLWGIKRGRPWLARFVVYWTSLTVGPVLLAVSLSLTSAAQSSVLALGCMIKVALAFRRGAAPPTLLDLLPGTRSVLQAEQEVLERLADAGLLRAVSLEAADGEADGGEYGYVPGRDPSRVSVEEIIATLRDEGAAPADLDAGGVVGALAREVLGRTRAAAGEIAGALTLGDVADRAEEGRARMGLDSPEPV